jgi:hypothetical protein
MNWVQIVQAVQNLLNDWSSNGKVVQLEVNPWFSQRRKISRGAYPELAEGLEMTGNGRFSS